MRLRAGLILSLLAILVAVGCRKPLQPNVDRNEAPETWITGAPQDTITERDEDGIPRVSPIGTIPVRYHLYWAGSDVDGEVAGFYYAVVETIPVPPPGLSLPSLPGPRPRDYRFTTKTDSIFIFNVSEYRPDRQHAFFIYAVDEKGKADPTPARFVFNALDRFPPDPYIYEARGTGPIYRALANGTLFTRDTTIFIRDSLTIGNLGTPPRDTIPRLSELVFRWRGEPTIEGTYVTGYKYKLDEADFFAAPAESVAKIYSIGSVQPGSKLFTLRVLDQAGGARETNRRFQVNFAPDSWFSGPDPARFPLVDGERVLAISNWDRAALRGLPELAGTMLSSDSLVRLPTERSQRKTFYEIYGNRLYIRSEGDTVHLNSWVVFHGGGSDLDSPYSVKAALNEPALADTQFVVGQAKVVRPGPPNGSPIGFRTLYNYDITPNSRNVLVPQSGTYPVYDAARVDRNINIAAYIPTIQAGQWFVALRAVDGDEVADDRVANPKRTYFGADPAIRSRVTMFYVDRPPYLLFNQPGFVPRPDTTFFTRSNLKFNLFAADDDPFDPENRPIGPGGPSTSTVLRWTVVIKGKDGSIPPRDTTYLPPGAFQVSTPQITIDNIPSYIVGPDVSAQIELCDCSDCEIAEGSGRCVNIEIPFHIPTAAPAGAAGPSSMLPVPRPGLEVPTSGRSRP